MVWGCCHRVRQDAIVCTRLIKFAQRFGFVRANPPIGHHPAETLQAVARQVAKQHPVKTKLPAMLPACIDALAPVRRIHSPADARLRTQPCNRGNSEASRPNRRSSVPDSHKAKTSGAVNRPDNRPQQVEKTAGHGLLFAGVQIGKRIGNAQLRRGPAKHGGNGTGIHPDVRRGHENIPRVQIWQGLKQIQQAIMQILDLAHGRVADMKLHRPVARLELKTLVRQSRPVNEI